MHLHFDRVHGTGKCWPRNLAVPLDRVSVPDPEETAWQRHGKIQATALNQLLAIHVAATRMRGECRYDACLVRCRPYVAHERTQAEANAGGARGRSLLRVEFPKRRPTALGQAKHRVRTAGAPGNPEPGIHLARQFGPGGPAPAAGANPQEADLQGHTRLGSPDHHRAAERVVDVAGAIAGAEFLRLGQGEGLLQRPPGGVERLVTHAVSGINGQDGGQVPREVASQGPWTGTHMVGDHRWPRMLNERMPT